MDNNEFYTFQRYTRQYQNSHGLTPSMEDYLEMIYRLTLNKYYTRIIDLAGALNVQPPSATKMVQKLAEIGLLNYEKYGVVKLTPAGLKIGEILLRRHDSLEAFLRLLGVTNNVLEDTEKIEHNLSTEALECIHQFVSFIEAHPQYLDEFHNYQKSLKNNP
jgi:Mn-dependent DtxR family transcriptional regulator